MNDREKNRNDEIPELKLERDVIKESQPEDEPEIEPAGSDFTMIDDLAGEAPAAGEASEADLESSVPEGDEPLEVELDAADITIIEDALVADEGLVASSAPESEDQGRGGTIPEVSAEEPDFQVLDYRSFADNEAEESESFETPALDQKVREKTGGHSHEKAEKADFTTRMFKAGEIIFKEGDPGDEAYLILNGQVKITRRFKNKRMTVNQLGKDQIFGEMAIITGEPRSATAQALEPTNVFVITEEKLQEHLSHNMAIIKNLIDQLIARMKLLMKQQSTMIRKVERSLLIDKKLEVIKAQIQVYEKKKGSKGMDDKLRSLLDSILKI